MTGRRKRFDALSEEVMGAISDAGTSHDSSAGPRKPKTFLGRESQKLEEATAHRVQELESQLRNAKEELERYSDSELISDLDPTTIRRSRFANRSEFGFGDQPFLELMDSIKEAGSNEVPIKVRPITDDGEGHHYEVVYGHRRHEACKRLGLPVRARIQELTDQALIGQMLLENQYREDLSPYEEGIFYTFLMDEGIFPSLRALATELGLDRTHVSRRTRILKLPPEVLDALADPRLVGMKSWLKLQEAIEASEASTEAAVRAANEIIDRNKGVAGTDLTEAEIEARLQELMRAARPRSEPLATVKETTLFVGTKKVGQLKRKGNSVTVKLSGKAPDGIGDELESAISEFFKNRQQ